MFWNLSKQHLNNQINTENRHGTTVIARILSKA